MLLRYWRKLSEFNLFSEKNDDIFLLFLRERLKRYHWQSGMPLFFLLVYGHLKSRKQSLKSRKQSLKSRKQSLKSHKQSLKSRKQSFKSVYLSKWINYESLLSFYRITLDL